MPMQPRPTADTFRPLLPSSRSVMVFPFLCWGEQIDWRGGPTVRFHVARPQCALSYVREQQPCHGSGDRSGGLPMFGQAIEDTLSPWFCETQAEFGCVAGRDGGRERAGRRTADRWGGTKVITSARNLPGSQVTLSSELRAGVARETVARCHW